MEVLLGLGAAVGWGMADVIAALTARRLGASETLVIAQVVGVAALTPMVVWGWEDFQQPEILPSAAILLSLGVVTAVGFAGLFRGLQLGPIALVSPIIAAANGVTAILALLVLHEFASVQVTMGICLTLLGAILTAARRREARESWRRGGIPHALIAMVVFGAGLFVVGAYSGEFGWLMPVYLWRLGAAVAVALLLGHRVSESVRHTPRFGVTAAAAALVGALDVAALASYSLGSEVGQVSVVAATSAAFPVIPIAVGVVALHERLIILQWIGVALIVLGLIILSVFR